MTLYFSVPKGEYIKTVYNGTSIGINTSLWDHHFALHTVGSNLFTADNVTFMADQAIGDIFLNFMLSEEVRPFFVVDAMNVRTEVGW